MTDETLSASRLGYAKGLTWLKKLISPFEFDSCIVESGGSYSIYKWDDFSTEDDDGAVYISSSKKNDGKWVLLIEEINSPKNFNTVQSVSDLVSEKAESGNVRIVSNPDTGGIFRAVNGGTANDGTIFNSATSGWTWQRVYSGQVNIKWFGAVGDGATNDQEAIQKALDASKNVYIPAGTFLVRSAFLATAANQGLAFDYALNVKNSQIISGSGPNSIIKTDEANTTIFSSSERFSSRIVLENFKLQGPSSAYAYPSGGCGVRIGNEVGVSNGQLFYSSRLSNLIIEDFALNGVRLLNEFSNKYEQLEVQDNKGHQMVMLGGAGSYLNSCYVGTVPTANKAGYRILRRGLLIACNGTSSSSDDDAKWGWFGNKSSGNDPEIDSGIGFLYAYINLTKCNLEHWVTEAVRLDEDGSVSFDTCTFIQNGATAGVIVYVNSSLTAAGDICFKNCESFSTGGITDISCNVSANVISDESITVYRRDTQFTNNRTATALKNWGISKRDLEQYAPYYYIGRGYIDQLAIYTPSISSESRGRILKYIEEKGENVNSGYDGRCEELFRKKTDLDLTSSVDLFSVDFTEIDQDKGSGGCFSNVEVDLMLMRSGAQGGYYSEKVLINFGTLSQAISSDAAYSFNNIQSLSSYEKAGPSSSASIGANITWTATQQTVKNTTFTVSIAIPTNPSWAFNASVDICTYLIKSTALRKFGGLKITRI